MTLNLRWILCGVLVSFMVACGGGGGGNDNAPNSTVTTNNNDSNTILNSIDVTPQQATIAEAATLQMSASGNYSNGVSDDISNAVLWSVDNPAVASITASGLLTGLSGGEVTVTAVQGITSGETTVTVTTTTTATTTAPPATATGTELRISEISSGSVSNGFWFELYNPTAEVVELSQFMLKSQNHQTSADVILSLPSKLVPAGEYLVVMTEDLFASDPRSSFLNNPNVVILDNADYSWNTQGYIELLANGETVDFVRFGNNAQIPTSEVAWSGGAAPAFTIIDYNQSISRDAVNTDTDDVSDWVLRDTSSMGGPNDITCATDDDEDGIPDCSELPGSTYAGMDLYAWGARVNQKDLFVEIDYMDPASRPGEDLQGMLPQREALDKVTAEFLANGIHVHFDAGDIFDQNPGENPLSYDLGGGGFVPFTENTIFKVFPRSDGANTDPTVADIYDYKAQHLSLNRRPLFYYILLAYAQAYYTVGVNGSSGVSELLGNDVLISMGHWGLSRSNTIATNEVINLQAGTLMHEFGHALGLNHGGALADSENYKPNYLSVMNYMYQLNGLPVIGLDEGDRHDLTFNRNNVNCDTGLTNSPYSSYLNFKIGYSDGSSMDLDEQIGITEAQGFGRPNSAGVDFNCDGDTNDVLVNFDVNDNGVNLMDDHDDWANIRYFFTSSIRHIANGGERAVNANLFVGRNWQEPKAIFVEPAIPQLKEKRARAYNRAFKQKYHTQ